MCHLCYFLFLIIKTATNLFIQHMTFGLWKCLTQDKMDLTWSKL